MGKGGPAGGWKTRAGRRRCSPELGRSVGSHPRPHQLAGRCSQRVSAESCRRGGAEAWEGPVGAAADFGVGCWSRRWRGWSSHSGTPRPVWREKQHVSLGLASSILGTRLSSLTPPTESRWNPPCYWAGQEGRAGFALRCNRTPKRTFWPMQYQSQPLRDAELKGD